MPQILEVLSDPAYDPSSENWYRTLVYVDKNGNKYGQTIYFSAPTVEGLPQHESSYLQFSSGLIGAYAGLRVGLTISSGMHIFGNRSPTPSKKLQLLRNCKKIERWTTISANQPLHLKPTRKRSN